jgi:MFS family permease
METSLENRKIEIGQETLNKLNTTRKWTMFLAIIGFIFLGLFIVIGVIAGTFLSAFNSGKTGLGIPESLMFVIFLVLAVICFFPILFLFRFSKHTANAVLTLDKQELHKAFKNLKSYFVYLGVLIIIVLTFYVVALIVAGTSMAFLKSLG